MTRNPIVSTSKRHADRNRTARTAFGTARGAVPPPVLPPAPAAHDEGQDRPPRLLTRRQVEVLTGLARSTLYRMMRAGTFPNPIRVGQRAVRWLESEILAWIASRPRATRD